MRCHEFEARLNDLLDLRLDPTADRPLALHAAHCGDCRTLLAGYVDIVTAFDDLPAPAPKDDLAWRVLRQWSPASLNSRWRSYVPHLVSAAAMLLVALLLSRSSPERDAILPDKQLAQRSVAAPVEPAAVTEESPEMLMAANEAELPGATLQESATGVLADVAELWPALPDPQALLTTLREAESLLAATTMPVVEPAPDMAVMAGGLKPLADSTDAAMRFLFDVFSQAIPAGGTPLDAPAGAAPPRSTDEAS